VVEKDEEQEGGRDGTNTVFVSVCLCLESGREGERKEGRLQASAKANRKANRKFNQPKTKEKKEDRFTENYLTIYFLALLFCCFISECHFLLAE
jgi:hypothetical protein